MMIDSPCHGCTAETGRTPTCHNAGECERHDKWKAQHEKEREETRQMKTRQIARCRRIAEKYGVQNQEKQAVSEIAELNLVLTRRPAQRGETWEEKTGKSWRNSLIEEIADVYIMLEQMLILHGINKIEVDEEIEYKLDRQIDRIAREAET